MSLYFVREGAHAAQACTPCPPLCFLDSGSGTGAAFFSPEAVPTSSLGSVPPKLSCGLEYHIPSLFPVYHSSQALFYIRILLQTTSGSQQEPAQRNCKVHKGSTAVAFGLWCLHPFKKATQGQSTLWSAELWPLQRCPRPNPQNL